MDVITVTNNGDTTYTIEFSDPITITNPGGFDVNLQFFSPSDGDWEQVTTTGPATGNFLTVTAFTSALDYEQMVLLGQPTTFASTKPFKTAGPLDPVT